MNRTDLIRALRDCGVDQQTSKDLFLYYLTTEDRQLQMYEWLKVNAGNCDSSSVLSEAQKILSGYLAKNPYNLTAKDMPIPKWTPPKPAKTVPTPKTVTRHEAKPKPDEDPFDKVLQAFFTKTDR